MAKHPGDPKSDVFGEQPFDPHEYPANYREPPKEPPITPNAQGYVAYRGSEQHGVEFQGPGTAFMPYLGEAKAHGKYVDPTITPRDIKNIPPVKVEVVSNPSLIDPRHVRFMSYTFEETALPLWKQVVQPERFRKRAVVYAATNDGSTARIRIAESSDATEVNSLLRVIPAVDDIVVIDGEIQAGIYVWVVDATAPVTISIQLEYYDYEGAQLL